MSGFPGSPRLLKAGLVILDAGSGAVQRVIPLQYNPDSLSRSLQPRGTDGETATRAFPLRLYGPAIETLRLEAEIDASDELAAPAEHPAAVAAGIHPQLAALEAQLYPASAQLARSHELAASGTLEIAPPEGPLVLFVWSRNRVLPVRITEFSVTEEAFDAALNPIRARVSLGLRVLTVDDLGFTHRGGSLFMSYLRQKEGLAAAAAAAPLDALGINAGAV